MGKRRCKREKDVKRKRKRTRARKCERQRWACDVLVVGSAGSGIARKVAYIMQEETGRSVSSTFKGRKHDDEFKEN